MVLTWPRITLVTATLNRGPWLQRMLASVARQEYPNLEFFVLDGGSQDDTCEQLRAAGKLVSRWVSQPDSGQAEALNRGFSWASGELVGWLNSDDILLPGSLEALGRTYLREGRPSLIVADVQLEDLVSKQKWLLRQRNISLQTFCEPWRHAVTWAQPGTYFRRQLMEETGPLRTDMHYLFDWEWMCRALARTDPVFLRQAVAAFRYHPDSKTSGFTCGWEADKRGLLQLHAPADLRQRPRLLQAAIELSLAQDCWACHWQARRQGWGYFQQALRLDWRVLGWRRTWLSALKALMPSALQRWQRAILQGY